MLKIPYCDDTKKDIELVTTTHGQVYPLVFYYFVIHTLLLRCRWG